MNDGARALGAPVRFAGAGRRTAAGMANRAGVAALVELLGGESPRSRRFLRGLMVGALAGAALAGGSRLGRRRRPPGR